jgi:hypothetical protein
VLERTPAADANMRAAGLDALWGRPHHLERHALVVAPRPTSVAE